MPAPTAGKVKVRIILLKNCRLAVNSFKPWSFYCFLVFISIICTAEVQIATIGKIIQAGCQPPR